MVHTPDNSAREAGAGAAATASVTDLLIATLMENAAQPLCVFTRTGHIVRVNMAFCDLTSRSHAQLEEENLFGFLNLSKEEVGHMRPGMSRRYYDQTLSLPTQHHLPVEAQVGCVAVPGQVDVVDDGLVYYALVTDLRLWQEKEALKRRMLLMARQRAISSDLHDNVAQEIALLGMRFSKLVAALDEAVLPETTRGMVNDCQELLDMAQAEMRHVIRHLREESSVRLEDCLWGMEDILRFAHDHMGLTVIDFGLANLSRLMEDVQAQISQLVREALTNVYRHAGTDTVWLTVVPDDGELKITVADRGCGFEPTNPSAGHYGLDIMRERMVEMGGRMDVSSTPGAGTTITLFLSLEGRCESEPSMPSAGQSYNANSEG